MTYTGQTLFNTVTPTYLQQLNAGQSATNNLYSAANNPYAVTQAGQEAALDYQQNFDNTLGQFFREIQRRGGNTAGLNDASLQNLAMGNVLGKSQAMAQAQTAEEERQLALNTQLAEMGSTAASRIADIGSNMYGAETAYASDQLQAETSMAETQMKNDASLAATQMQTNASMSNARNQYDTQRYIAEMQNQMNLHNIDTDAETQMYSIDMGYLQNLEDNETQLAITEQNAELQKYLRESGYEYQSALVEDAQDYSTDSTYLNLAIDLVSEYGDDAIKFFSSLF